MKKARVHREARRRARKALTFQMRSADDLARCVVMLDRPFTETITVDGRDFEVWLKPLGGGRAMPKLDRHLGTGFLVASDAAVYVVTAAHVARRMDREARVSYTGRRGARTALALTDLLAAASPKQVWTFHRTADVAVARLRPHPQLRGRCLPAELLAASASAPSGSLELVTVGFPLGLASERHFAPISKRARAASTVVRFRGEEMEQPADFFLLDQPVVGGYSGAPLFVAPQTRVTEGGRLATVTARCVGLLSQTIALEGIGQFTAVVPSRVIRRLLRGR